MSLDIADLFRRYPCCAQRLTNHRLLGLGIGRGQTIAVSILVDRRAVNERTDGIPILLSRRQAFQHHHAAALAQTLALLQTGGNRDLTPERARSWSLGFDYRPEALPGLTLSVTGFDVTFADQIGQPVLTDVAHVLTNPAFAPFVSRVDPASAADLARVKAIMAISTNANIGLFPAEAYRAIVDGRFVNTGEVHVRGLDLQAAYGWSAGADHWSLAGDLSYLSDYVRRFTPTAPSVELLDTPNNPVKLRGRLSLNWDRGPWGAGVGLAYAAAYRSETGRRSEAWTPVDLQARWTPAETGRPWSGLSLALNIQNLFDQDPPFINTTANGAGASSGTAWGFNAFNASPIGRTINMGVRVKL